MTIKWKNFFCATIIPRTIYEPRELKSGKEPKSYSALCMQQAFPSLSGTQVVGLEVESDRKGNLWACTARIQCGCGAHQQAVLTEVLTYLQRS